jgi:hypothetical protein
VRRAKDIDPASVDTTKQRKIRLNISGACENITINDMVHIVNLVPTKIVELIIDGCNIKQMITLAKKRK